MNILVTGGAGYIGSHLVQRLIEHGHTVVIVDRVAKETVEGEPRYYSCDLQDAYLDVIFSQHDFDAVAHLAAYSSVAESIEHPNKYLSDNVAGTLNLLENMRRNNVKQLLFTSSCNVYRDGMLIDEQHPLMTQSPYGTSKMMCEQMIEWYSELFGLNTTVLRLFNVIGLRDVRSFPTNGLRVIDIILRCAMQNKPFTMYGSNPVRDYIHVNDVTAVMEYMIAHRFFGLYNVGTGIKTQLSSVIDEVYAVTGKPVTVNTANRRLGDPMYLVSNPNKIKSLTGLQFSDTAVRDAVQQSFEVYKFEEEQALATNS